MNPERASQILEAVEGLPCSQLEKAMIAAHRLHEDQIRKAGGAPYLTHLLSVAALVLEGGADADAVAAAFLHDSIEDQGASLLDIERVFGAGVREIVQALTDTEAPGSPDHHTAENSMERKEAYLRQLESEDREGVLRVSLADKLDNARSLLLGVMKFGEAVWDDFNVSAEDMRRYLTEVARIFKKKLPRDAQADELASTAQRIWSVEG